MRGRFSTSRNETLSFIQYLNLPKAFYLAILRKYFKIYPKLPWIPFSAASKLNEIIKPNWIILEIGAGTSTLWLANRSKKVTSIEASKEWFDTLNSKIKSKKIGNIDLRFEWTAEKMSDFNEYPNNHFDLIYIDGGPRELCCINAIPKVKKGGYIYLDNSDSDVLSGKGAEILQDYVNNPLNIEKFIDFVPGNFMINEGLLARLV
ncbi:methyltransferase domain-containing protein [Pedobacter petrophilus]|uniref:Methyltransferase domain-containing protein n=1 Tax=Pedobacter petrophilus TaxID=1908241 RepID=A0A7K0FY33_9SPHI|nr:class I SAM-dependent methyltransferase [Pedobacter petrophilus]MRX75626.1 methyltransferase domain-containing protein [Pedobacter petrophilus]